MKSEKHLKLITGGQIYCSSSTGIITWEEAVLFENGIICAVGKNADLRDAAADAEIIDIGGSILFPGFCDAHLHLAAGGHSLELPNLLNLADDQVRTCLASALGSDPGKIRSWLQAFNLDPTSSKIDASWLDRHFPGAAIILHQVDLHGCCCSSEALRRAGIDASTPDPPGGKIGHDSAGETNGFLYESAISRVSSLVPPQTETDREQSILRAQRFMLQSGITAVSEVLSTDNVEIYNRLDEAGKLLIRVNGWIRYEDWDGASSPPPPGDRFHIDTLKFFLDGSFGSRTAALQDPYEEDDSSRGILFKSDSELGELIQKAQERGWKTAVHAIGDRAVSQVFRVLQEIPARDGIIHRIEHLQLAPAEGVEPYRNLRVIASIQPIHLLDDQKWLIDRIGTERCRRSFPWRSLLDNNIPLALGSDWPVADPNPLRNLHTVINRCDFNREVIPELNQPETLHPHQAIQAITSGWAEGASLSRLRGRISTGMEADFTAVSGLNDDLKDWSSARVEMTVTRGEIRYKAPG